MQKKKGPFTIIRSPVLNQNEFSNIIINRLSTVRTAEKDGKRSRSPLYIENILREIDIPPEKSLTNRKMIIRNPEGNISPASNSTSDTGGPELAFGEIYGPRIVRQDMIYDPAQSLSLINHIAREREFSSEDYELLLQLDRLHSIQSQNGGLEDYVINSFPFRKVGKKIKDGTEGEEIFRKCVICLHDMKPGQMERELPCNHIFHKNCIDKWLKSDSRCPLDNQNIKDLL